MINYKILEIITAKYYGTLHGEICISPLSSQLIFIMTIYCWIYNNWIYKNDVLKRSHAVTIFILAKYKSRLYLFLAMSRIFVRIEALHNNVFKMYRWIIFTIFSFILLLHNKKIIYQSLIVNQYRRWIPCKQKWNIHEYYFFFYLMNYFKDNLF